MIVTNKYSKKKIFLSFLIISLISIFPCKLFIHILDFNKPIKSFEYRDISLEDRLKNSEYAEVSISYDHFAGYYTHYSSGYAIYWDFINHDNVNIRVLAMTETQFFDAIDGKRPIQYYSLLGEDSQGYGYFTVPSTGSWAIVFYHHDSSNPIKTDVYLNVHSYPYLRITQPSSTEKWVKKDTLYRIEWTNYYVADARLELWKGLNYIQDISPYLLRDGFDCSYDWQVPNSLDESSDYRIKIINRVNPNIYDFSDYFEIYENDIINVIHPNSNSTFGTGTRQDIVWTWRGPISSVNIELWNQTDMVTQITLSPTECDGVYSWELPYYLSEGVNYKVKIIDHDNPNLYNFSGFFSIYDALPPIITINSPTPFQLYGLTAPFFDLTIDEPNIHKKWYSLNGGDNITFSTETKINQIEWDKYGNGTVLITFYVNDTAGNLNYCQILVRKDTYAPIILIHSPISNQIFGTTPPSFNITIIEANTVNCWYTIEGVSGQFDIIELIGIIDQNAWNEVSEGQVEITFYAKDQVDNLRSYEVVVIKELPSEEFSLTLFITLSVLGFGLIFGIMSIYWLRRRKRET